METFSAVCPTAWVGVHKLSVLSQETSWHVHVSLVLQAGASQCVEFCACRMVRNSCRINLPGT